MRKVVFRTDAEKARGLIGMSPIPKDTLFIFPNIRPGTHFHSRGVLHKFEIAFANADGTKTEVHRVTPPNGRVKTPSWATVAIEAAAGTFPCLKAGDGFRGLGELPQTKSYFFPLLTVAVGLGLSMYGWKRRNDHIGLVLTGAGSSMVATGIVLGIAEFLR